MEICLQIAIKIPIILQETWIQLQEVRATQGIDNRDGGLVSHELHQVGVVHPIGTNPMVETV